MPVHKVAGGWKWGHTGKVYPTRRQAEAQMEAIYAAGYKEQFGNKETMYGEEDGKTKSTNEEITDETRQR